MTLRSLKPAFLLLALLGLDLAGDTQLCVRWRLPNGVEQRPIPGARLAPPDP